MSFGLGTERAMGPFRHFINRTIVPRTLFWRSLLIVVLPIIVLQLVLTYAFYNRHWDTVTRWLAVGVAGEVALLGEMLEQAATPEERSQALDTVRRFTDLRLSFEPGARLTEAGEAAGLDGTFFTHIDNKIVEGFEEVLDRPFLLDLRFDHPASVAVYVEVADGVLRVVAPRKRVTSTTTGLLLIWMIGASVALALIALYFLRLQIRPIRLLAKAVDSFGKGRDIGDFTPRGAVEIRLAARAFNRMRQRILRHLSQRTDMLAAVSHDLRTPLTRMRLDLEMLGADDDPVLAGLKSDVQEMTDMVESYLAFVRDEGQERIEPTALQPVLTSLCERAERHGRRCEVTLDEPITLPLRPVAFRRCLANLVDNACRHAGWIGITAHRNGSYVEIAVEDDGPGIPDQERHSAMQPFTRLDQGRGRTGGGLGLGLAIARDIVLGHGGELTLLASQRGGLKALLKVPL
jgi:two-component system, OmpR family, osmolarity sensor histidine kinase EnvZ